jgi:hypothetical protein
MAEFPQITDKQKETPMLVMNGTGDQIVYFTDAKNTLDKKLNLIYIEPYDKNYTWRKLEN